MCVTINICVLNSFHLMVIINLAKIKQIKIEGNETMFYFKINSFVKKKIFRTVFVFRLENKYSLSKTVKKASALPKKIIYTFKVTYLVLMMNQLNLHIFFKKKKKKPF